MKTPPVDFILANTTPTSPPHVPKIQLHLADEAHDLWHKTEVELGQLGLPPPFWAFAWAGGQGLARYLFQNPSSVTGKNVLDFASGSGLVAIAAAMTGAGKVLAADIDPWSIAAIRLNSTLNNVKIPAVQENLIGVDDGWDVVLAGDVFYDRALAESLTPWFRTLAKRGARVLVGDPGRAYLPKSGLIRQGVFSVPVTRILEDSEIKQTAVLEFLPE